MQISPNTVIENYKFIRLVGSGGMGEVYEALDMKLQRRVAIKVLGSALLSNPSLVERFIREAKILASMSPDHNIVHVYSYFENSGNYYFVMEFIEGETVKDRIKRKGLIPEEEAEKIVLDVLKAIEAAHNHSVVHRDIKPSNIMLKSDGTVKLMDFGIAKNTNKADLDSSHTSTSARLGTIPYMSPEQIRSTKDVDKRTDIFSLGITYYEMLTGKLPYNTNGVSEYDLMEQIVKMPLTSPKTHYLHISDKAVRVIEKMTEKDVSHRFASCEEVRKDIQQPPPPPPPPPPPWWKKLLVPMVIIFTIFGYLGYDCYNNKDQSYLNQWFGGICEEQPHNDLLTLVSTIELLETQSSSDIYSASINNDFSKFAIGRSDGTIELFGLSFKEELYLKYLKSISTNTTISAIKFNNDDLLVGTYSDGIIHVNQSGEVNYVIQTDKSVYDVDFTSEMGYIYNTKGSLEITYINKSKEIFQSSDIRSISISQDNSKVVITNMQGDFTVCRFPDLETIAKNNLGSKIRCSEFISDDLIVFGLKNGSIVVYNLYSKQKESTNSEAHNSEILTLKYDSEKKLLYSFCYGTNILKIWKINI